MKLLRQIYESRKKYHEQHDKNIAETFAIILYSIHKADVHDFSGNYREVFRMDTEYSLYKFVVDNFDLFKKIFQVFGFEVSRDPDITLSVKIDSDPFLVMPLLKERLQKYLLDKLTTQPYAEIRMYNGEIDQHITAFLEYEGFKLRVKEREGEDNMLIVSTP